MDTKSSKKKKIYYCQYRFADGKVCKRRCPKGHRFLCNTCFKRMNNTHDLDILMVVETFNIDINEATQKEI